MSIGWYTRWLTKKTFFFFKFKKNILTHPTDSRIKSIVFENKKSKQRPSGS